MAIQSLYSKSRSMFEWAFHFPNENVLIWNEVFSETRGRLRTLQRHDHLWSVWPPFDFPDRLQFFCLGTRSCLASHLVCSNTFTLHFLNKNVPQSTQSSLKWNLLWNSWSSSDSSKTWLALNVFTLHFPIENILHSTQSSLKWSLLWNPWSSEYPIFSEMKFYPKYKSLYSKWRSMFECIHSSFPEWKRSPDYTIFSKMKSYLKWSLLWNLWSSSNASKVWSSLFELFKGVVGFELIFVFELFKSVVVSEPVILFELFKGVVGFELVFVFELFEGMLTFELFNRPSTSRIDLNFFRLRTLLRRGCLWTRFWLWTLRRRGHFWTRIRLQTLRRCGRDFPDWLEFFSSSNSGSAPSIKMGRGQNRKI